MEVANDLSGAILDDRYRVLEPVAEGAMGVVYRAERLKLGRIVAVKVLHDELPDELSSRKRFEIEAMAMSRLDHPHCAAVLDVGTYDGKPYVVMDFVTGPDLKAVIAEGPLPVARAVEILRQVLSGLAHAHELGIIHRDIKPANIILSHKVGLGDHVKILDFGLARLQQEQTSKLTTGIVVGTPAYMAPEQVRGKGIDARADLYACGILLMELITGKKPFHSPKDDPIEVVQMHLKTPPPTLAALVPGAAFGELEAVVARALAKSADDRYQSATEFAAALEAAQKRTAAALARTEPAGSVLTDSAALQISESMMLPHGGTELGLPATVPPAPAATLPPVTAPPVAAPPEVAPPVAAPPDSLPIGSVPVPAPVRPAPHLPPEQPWAPGPAPARGPDGLPFTRRQLAYAGGGLLLLVVIIAIAAGGGGQTTPAASSGGSADAGAPGPEIEMPASSDDGARKLLGRAEELIANGEREAALQLLLGARATYSDNAEIPYVAGTLYLGKLWWDDGLTQLRAAIKLEPSYRSDPELIKLVLKGFLTTPSHNRELATFLTGDIGEPARSYLEETARDHPNPNLRARAKAELKRLP